MSIHIDKQKWIAGKKLKKIGKLALFGTVLFLFTTAAFPILIISGALATKIIIDRQRNLDYIDYIMDLDD